MLTNFNKKEFQHLVCDFEFSKNEVFKKKKKKQFFKISISKNWAFDPALLTTLWKKTSE